MFSDIGILEVLTLVVLAMLIFGPEKLPKVIQDVAGFIRKIREFSDSAKHDIRSELGPDFKDFEFEDLNPKTFIRKHLNESDDLRELKELGSSFDFTKEMNDVADTVHGTDSSTSSASVPAAVNGSSGTPDLLKKRDQPVKDERPPFDADAT
ncbi:sec-independent translocase [Streptomyces sp. NPDC005963]|uniref:sec-independent translocase n=1 Tax=Streptomyces sp. NPDC005963 TaxID=3156721 RepID=UPI00340EF782